MEFQSTPPVKAATRAKFLRAKTYIISIHAAREGGDFVIVAVARNYRISIHAAREGGDVDNQLNLRAALFQSTPPVKAATFRPALATLPQAIFQSTPPVKAATCAPVTAAVTPLFQSTPPVKAATSVATAAQNILPNFNPRRP